MKNILLKIEYVGTKYQGWQTQRVKSYQIRQKTVTIQESIEVVLRKVLQQKVRLIASGRTDAGVHAKGQYANFKTSSTICPVKLKKALNGLLPDDIRIQSVKYVNSDFHARYHAKSKVYRYTILNREYGSAFIHGISLHVHNALDVKLMQREVKALKGRHDFKSFQAVEKKRKKSVRTIKNISVKKRGSLILIDIEADGFLYNMVRNIVGTLIELGRGRIKPGGVKRILAKKDRKYAGPTAPAHGLCLIKVVY